MKGFWQGFEKKALSSSMRGALLGAGIGGLGMGGLGYALASPSILKKTPEWQKVRSQAKRRGLTKGTPAYEKFVSEEAKKIRLAYTAAMGIQGALTGGMLGDMYGTPRRYSAGFGGGHGQGYRRQAYQHADTLGSSKKIIGLTGLEKTKTEAKKKFRDLARKTHPDIGGSAEKMKEINSAWDTIERSDWFQKLAFIRRQYGRVLGWV